MVLKSLGKDSIKMNSKWCYITIVAHIRITPTCFDLYLGENK